MSIPLRVLSISFFLLCSMQEGFSQDSSGLYNKILHFPDRLFKRVNDKSDNINQKLTTKTAKYLQDLSRHEKKLKSRLAKKDSNAAHRLFDGAELKYAELELKMRNASANTAGFKDKYVPHLDTLKTAFKFLEKGAGLLDAAVGTKEKLSGALGKMDELQGKFNQAEEVRNYIQQRKEFLRSELGKYNMSKYLNKYQQQVYYYQAQVDEYKRMFEDPSKLEAKAIELLKRTKVFQDFFSRNSQLAGLFRLPGTSGTSAGSSVSLAGLQTRATINQDLLQRYGSGANIQQTLQDQAQGAKNELSKLKDKLNELKSGSKGNGDPSMPDFKPNNQKTKSLKDRLELGSNLQTVKSNMFFPSTSDIGLSLGYKLNDKSTVGFGGSYKVGWGKDIRHISISHQGVGVRSFIDYRIKGGFWLSGGGEFNYRNQFSNFEILNDYSAWQTSALMGLTKKYQVSKKVKGNAQILFDALWKGQVPRTQPILFRVGYSLK